LRFLGLRTNWLIVAMQFFSKFKKVFKKTGCSLNLALNKQLHPKGSGSLITALTGVKQTLLLS